DEPAAHPEHVLEPGRQRDRLPDARTGLADARQLEEVVPLGGGEELPQRGVRQGERAGARDLVQELLGQQRRPAHVAQTETVLGVDEQPGLVAVHRRAPLSSVPAAVPLAEGAGRADASGERRERCQATWWARPVARSVVDRHPSTSAAAVASPCVQSVSPGRCGWRSTTSCPPTAACAIRSTSGIATGCPLAMLRTVPGTTSASRAVTTARATSSTYVKSRSCTLVPYTST